MSDSANYGISGTGNITAQNIAVGPNATINADGASNIIDQSNRSELFSGPLTDLRCAIEALQGQPETRDALISTHAEIAEELESPEPDKGRILGKLAVVKQLAGPAATIVQAAAVLTQAIISIL
jgi:hypothetical protein